MANSISPILSVPDTGRIPSGPRKRISPPNSITVSDARQPKSLVTLSNAKLAKLFPTNLLILSLPKIYSWLRNPIIWVIVKPTLITPAPEAGEKSKSSLGAEKYKLYG